MKHSKAEDFHLSVEDAIAQWWITYQQALDQRQASLLGWDDIVDLYWENYNNA